MTNQPTTTNEERRAEVRAVLAEVRRARLHPAVLATRAALLDDTISRPVAFPPEEEDGMDMTAADYAIGAEIADRIADGSAVLA